MTLNEYFKKQNRLEEEAMLYVIRWLESFGFELLGDVRKNEAYREKDIDLLMKDTILGEFGVEVKVRAELHNDIAIETISNVERNTVGYIDKSQAIFLAYVFYIDGKLHPHFLMYLPKLREWFLKNKHRYKPKYAPNPPEKPVYYTEFYPVPIKDIPPEVFFPENIRI